MPSYVLKPVCRAIRKVFIFSYHLGFLFGVLAAAMLLILLYLEALEASICTIML